MLCSPNSTTPIETMYSCLDEYILLSATHTIVSTSILLHNEALSFHAYMHFGSHTPLPTLKPNVTILAPRLGTGCWLGFTR